MLLLEEKMNKKGKQASFPNVSLLMSFYFSR